MILKIKNQNKSIYAFTLIEMLIVLIIMGIMLMVTLYLSNDQIQRVRDKTVKESILAEMQSRYSRNLWSSSYASWIMYNSMEVTFSGEENKIDFKYNAKNSDTQVENTFIDNFKIIHIVTDYENENLAEHLEDKESITLKYTPYKISCEIWEDDSEVKNVIIIARVNDSRDYCFEIFQKNCRLFEMSANNCNDLISKFEDNGYN